jgi:hypothetical protein
MKRPCTRTYHYRHTTPQSPWERLETSACLKTLPHAKRAHPTNKHAPGTQARKTAQSIAARRSACALCFGSRRSWPSCSPDARGTFCADLLECGTAGKNKNSQRDGFSRTGRAAWARDRWEGAIRGWTMWGSCRLADAPLTACVSRRIVCRMSQNARRISRCVPTCAARSCVALWRTVLDDPHNDESRLCRRTVLGCR